MGSSILGTEILADDSELSKLFFNPISGHGIETFEISGGSVKIKVDGKKADQMAREMKDKLHNIDKAIKALEKYMENTKKQAKQIESEYVNKLLSGSHEFISPSDIENYVEELSKSGHYDFFDEALFEDTIGELKYTKQRLSQFSEKIIDATKKFEDRDKEISEIYRWFEGGIKWTCSKIYVMLQMKLEKVYMMLQMLSKKKLKKMPKSQWRKHVYLL